ncbi:hypothetical protein ARMSODRAFT_897507, partial [Armillaria solidipes]
RIVTSYDIACQWSINLEDHIQMYGESLRPQISKMLYLVPKFHLPGHIKDCQDKYCISCHIHVGKNDGEASERGWAVSNGMASSTREMGPRHRCKKLDQHFEDFNWQKNVLQGSLSGKLIYAVTNITAGDTLLRKIKDAVHKASEHED